MSFSRHFWRWYVPVASIIIAATAVRSARTAGQQRAQLEEEVRQRAVAAVKQVAELVQEPLGSGDLQSVRTLVHGLPAAHPEIASGLVVGWTGRVLAHSDARYEGQWMFDLLPPPAEAMTRPLARRAEAHALEVTVPLHAGAAEQGSLRAEVLVKPARIDRAFLTRPCVEGGLALLALGVVGLRRGSRLQRDRILHARRSPAAASFAHRPLATRAVPARETAPKGSGRVGGDLRLEIDAIESGEGVFDPHQLVADVTESLAAAAHQKGLELVWWVEPDVPAALAGPSRHLREILSALITNAVRCTDHGEVEVTARRDREEGGHLVVRLAVRDTGPGFDEAQRARLFSGAETGAGDLGLPHCKELVELMDGHLGCESTPQHGTTFWMTLPLRRAGQTRSRPLQHDEDALRRYRVMIVDDNDASRRIIARQLQSWGIPHEAIGGGREALTRLRAAADYGAPYILALLDTSMPEMHDLALVRAIRNEALLCDLRLVLLTSGPVLPLDGRRELGLSATLAKPVRPARLYTCLAGVLLANFRAAIDGSPPASCERP